MVLLTVKQVAARLGVGPGSVHAAISAGELESIRLGRRTIRISEEALRAYLDAKTVRARRRSERRRDKDGRIALVATPERRTGPRIRKAVGQ